MALFPARAGIIRNPYARRVFRSGLNQLCPCRWRVDVASVRFESHVAPSCRGVAHGAELPVDFSSRDRNRSPLESSETDGVLITTPVHAPSNRNATSCAFKGSRKPAQRGKTRIGLAMLDRFDRTG